MTATTTKAFGKSRKSFAPRDTWVLTAENWSNLTTFYLSALVSYIVKSYFFIKINGRLVLNFIPRETGLSRWTTGPEYLFPFHGIFTQSLWVSSFTRSSPAYPETQKRTNIGLRRIRSHGDIEILKNNQMTSDDFFPPFFPLN